MFFYCFIRFMEFYGVLALEGRIVSGGRVSRDLGMVLVSLGYSFCGGG